MPVFFGLRKADTKGDFLHFLKNRALVKPDGFLFRKRIRHGFRKYFEDYHNLIIAPKHYSRLLNPVPFGSVCLSSELNPKKRTNIPDMVISRIQPQIFVANNRSLFF